MSVLIRDSSDFVSTLLYLGGVSAGRGDEGEGRNCRVDAVRVAARSSLNPWTRHRTDQVVRPAGTGRVRNRNTHP